MPICFLDIWTMDDLFEYIDIYASLEKSSTEAKETFNSADEMEAF